MNFVWAYLRLAGCLVFTAYFLWMLISALKSGKIYHTDSVSAYFFRKEPLRFLLVFFLFATFASMFGYFTILAFKNVLDKI